MFSTISEAWGEDFQQTSKPIFKQNDTPEHFKNASQEHSTHSVCPCCKRPMDEKIESFEEEKQAKPSQVKVVQPVPGVKADNRDVIHAVMAGLLVILLLHLFNKR